MQLLTKWENLDGNRSVEAANHSSSRCQKGIDLYQKNRLFETEQSKCYIQINSRERRTKYEKPNALEYYLG